MDHLDRLYHRLVQALAEEGDGGASRPVAIAEIYQRLVPYRAVRDELGFGELAQYEHTLLRLLAGEREYLLIDVAQAQDDFRRELRSNNPLVGIYRDYAAVNVRLNQRAPLAVSPRAGDTGRSEATAATQSAGAVPPPPEPELPPSPVPPPAAAGAAGAEPEPPELYPAPEDAPPAGSRAIAGAAETEASGSAAQVPAAAAGCWSCHSFLPDRPELQFCPFCGQSQVALPCTACSYPVEPEWSFCIRCGIPRPQAQSMAAEPAGTPSAEGQPSSEAFISA